MNKKQNKTIAITSVILILVILLGTFAYFGLVRGAVIGVSNSLNYETRWTNQDLKTGSYESIGVLTLPGDVESFSFAPDYRFETYNRDSGDVNIQVSYKVLNYETGFYEIVHNKDWSLKNDYGEQNKFRMDGDSVYSLGVPEHFESINIQRGYYNRYYGCLIGMSVDEAKELNPWTEGKSTYNYRCIYPGESIVKHEYDDDSNENYDIEYFPELITLDSKYINNTEAKIKISVIVKSSGIDSITQNDFGIDLWDVKTEVLDTYSFNTVTDSCDYQAKYTYQIIESEYYTKNECLYDNSVIECYLESQCDDMVDMRKGCDSGECIYSKETILDKIFPDKDEPVIDSPVVTFPEKEEPVTKPAVVEPVKKSNLLLFGLIGLIAIFLISIAFFLVRRK